MKRTLAILCGAVAMFVAGCQTTGTHEFDSNADAGAFWYRADRRGQVLVKEYVLGADGKPLMHDTKPVIRYKTLSENPPDVTLQTSIDAALKAEYAGVSGEARLKFGQTALQLGVRSERVNLMRDTLFALNQAVFNMPTMKPETFKEAYERVVTAVLAANLADAQTNATNLVATADVEIAQIETKLAEVQAALGAEGITKEQLDAVTAEPSSLQKLLGGTESKATSKERVLKLLPRYLELKKTLEQAKETKKSLVKSATDLTASLADYVGVESRAKAHTPSFTSTAPAQATVDAQYTYQATASTKGEGEPVFALVSGPQGLTVTASGAVTWTPTANQTGRHLVIIAVGDGQATAIQSWTIEVAPKTDK